MRFEYPPDLPVSAVRDEIAALIVAHQVVIVAGATGSGKTTQLPKIALELGRSAIAHTQPRRIAARSVAERVASELGVSLGAEVGYQVRFDRRAGNKTQLKLLTDGVLLAELVADPLLRRYDTVIIDEAHERSLTIDVLLGHLKRLLPERPDLRIIVTSATIDPESFAQHFAAADGTPAPIVEVEGRTYPVEIRYRPLIGESDLADDDGEIETSDRDYLTGILDALDELDREEPGDVLVFLSGEAEIRDATDAVRGHFANRPTGYGTTDVLPLFGRLAAADQQRIFDASRTPGTRRRVILSTNVAETSLTVPGIRYVIDTGMARISRYSARSRVQRLPIEPISQASAAQRAGRAGRTAPGIAIRLTSEDEFVRRPEYTDPEILRTSLASVLLQLAELGVDDPTEFPFLTPPDSRELRAARDVLIELGALSTEPPHTLTPLGRMIARIPLEPRYARMLVEASERGVTRDVMVIVAGLCIHDPRERPSEQREAAAAAHARFTDPTSDFFSLLGLWNYLTELQQSVSGNQFRKRCRAEFLHYLRVREWQDLVRQLERTVIELGLTLAEPKADPVAVHRSILPGLLSQIGARIEPTVRPTRTGPKPKGKPHTEYAGARGRRFSLSPGSHLRGNPPALVMAAELVETSRLYARTVAGVDPNWVISAAGPLVERSYSEPRWDRARGSAIVTERTSLYGVVLSAGERRQLGRLQPELARELFVRHALVLGEWDIERIDRRLTAFVRRNREVLGRWNAAANRLRERHRFDETGLIEWYLERIPATVTDLRSFERFWRDAVRETPELLTLPEPEREHDERRDASLFPREWQAGPIRYRLKYTHAPGQDEDGVNVLIAERDLARARELDLGWVVPGLRTELVAALLRSLPKTLRREVVPANAWAERLIRDLPGEAVGDFREELAALIKRVTFAPIRADDFDLSRLPAHLVPRYVVVGPNNRVLRASRSFDEIRPSVPATPVSATEVPTATAAPSAADRIGAIAVGLSTDTRQAARARAWATAALAENPELSEASLRELVQTALAGPIPAEIAQLPRIDKLAQAVDRAIRRASSIERVGELARERAQLEELTGAGFLERLSPDAFTELAGELRAALLRIDPNAKIEAL